MKRITMLLKKLLLILVYLESKYSKGNSRLQNTKPYDITRTVVYRNGQSHDYIVKDLSKKKKKKGQLML